VAGIGGKPNVLEDIGIVLPDITAQVAGRKPVSEGPYELIIIGGGPAGMTSAVYAARKKLHTLLVSEELGGQMLWTSDIENYMGYQYITGPELMARFHEQMNQYPIDMLIGEEVVKLAAEEGRFRVSTRTGRRFLGMSVIIASGKRSRELNVPGERELVGRGVSYCATCDAPLFAGRDVAVIGGGNSALTAVVDLIKLAKRIYVVNIVDDWQADSILLERARASDKMIPFLGHAVSEISGGEGVEGIVIESIHSHETKALLVGGVFIEIGLIPNSALAHGLLAMNQLDEIMVDCNCGTNVDGIYAAGDVTDVFEKQVIVAAGEGAKAALSAHRYLLHQGISTETSPYSSGWGRQ
jgi:alkyl hydroperoxide reductase subunit F